MNSLTADGSSRWADQLRDRGLRTTSARVHVLEALSELEHGTPEEVHRHAAQRSPGLNLSTVYRTLEMLAEHGVVSHTHLSHSSATYMLTEHAHHGHLVCRGCDAVDVLDSQLALALVSQVRQTQNFSLDTGHISLFGLCASCQSQAP